MKFECIKFGGDCPDSCPHHVIMTTTVRKVAAEHFKRTGQHLSQGALQELANIAAQQFKQEGGALAKEMRGNCIRAQN